MANYKETTVSGTSWIGCKEIFITNSYGRTPGIIFGEEKVVMIDGSASIIPLNQDVKVTFEADKAFPLLNSSTGEATGTTYTHKQLYEILYSLYIASAEARDAEVAERLASPPVVSQGIL